MSASEGLSTDTPLAPRRRREHRLPLNAGKSRNKSRKRCEHQDSTLVGSVPRDRPTIGLQAQSLFDKYFYNNKRSKLYFGDRVAVRDVSLVRKTYVFVKRLEGWQA
jgi:hypothetical protein